MKHRPVCRCAVQSTLASYVPYPCHVYQSVGLFSLAARLLGASVRSFDFDPVSAECTATLRKQYYPNDPQWVVVDCRFALSDPAAGKRAYEAGHIDRARYAHLNDDLSSPVTPQSGRQFRFHAPHRATTRLSRIGRSGSPLLLDQAKPS